MIISTKNSVFKVLLMSLSMIVSSSVFADYVPYPGKKQVRLISIEAANIVVINFETWPGYGKTVKIKLPDLVLPASSAKPPLCEIKLAKKALKFTQAYLKSFKKVTVEDMRMKTSADNEAISSVYTTKGSLAQALIKKGLARSSAIKLNKPWCK